MTEPGLEDELVASGRYLRLLPAGARTGVVVGFVERADESLVIAGGPEAAWAQRLRADARAQVSIGDRSFEVTASELEGAEHAAAIRDLILRYGTPAERLGSGPAFVLREVPSAPFDASLRSR
jgi:hypothetical protein